MVLKMKGMAKKDTSLSFGAFPNAEEFLLWVATYHGTNVSEICKQQIGEALLAGQPVDAFENILKPLIRRTRHIDPAKNKVRAQFGW
jgi:hypothetical protein